MDPKAVYTKKAEDYAAYRPGYAPAAIAALAALTGLRPEWRAADIGAGTGNLTRLLAPLVAEIHAVEPNEAMRRQAEKTLAGYASCRIVAATAEATTLPEHSVDLIVLGQAWHWFDAPLAREEFSRILKPGGWLAAVWNDYGGGGPPGLASYLSPEHMSCRSFPMSVAETWEQFLGGAHSAATAPDPGDAAYGIFVAEQRRVFDTGAVDGRIKVDYTTELAVGHIRV